MLSICPFYRGGNLKPSKAVKHYAQGQQVKQHAPSKGQKHDETQGHLACLAPTKLPLRSPDTASDGCLLPGELFLFTFTRYTTQVAAWVWLGELVCVRLCSACSFHYCSGLESRMSSSVPPHTCPSSTHPGSMCLDHHNSASHTLCPWCF